MNTQVITASAPDAIRQALALLQRGGVVAFPTDTVYGIGALAFRGDAIQRLYAIKGREQAKAIPVLIGSPAELAQVAEQPSPAALRLAQRFWPGALTLVVPGSPQLPAELSQTGTVGVRVPAHPVALGLLAAAGPLAVTSANLSGGADTYSAAEVLAQLEGRIELLLDGGVSAGAAPSTVVDATGSQPRVLRAGPISEAEILAALS